MMLVEHRSSRRRCEKLFPQEREVLAKEPSKPNHSAKLLHQTLVLLNDRRSSDSLTTYNPIKFTAQHCRLPHGYMHYLDTQMTDPFTLNRKSHPIARNPPPHVPNLNDPQPRSRTCGTPPVHKGPLAFPDTAPPPEKRYVRFCLELIVRHTRPVPIDW